MRLLLRYARFQLFDCVMLLQDAASDEPRDSDVDTGQRGATAAPAHPTPAYESAAAQTHPLPRLLHYLH